ncbi:MAG: hypothetical protein JXA78_07690, partial [Anaerolineales bacterium]|nr:hypothetical protein [Anaerolineales bacterium]
MTKLQRAIIILVLYLAVVFNLEKVATGELSVLSTQFLFYGMIILAMLSVFAIPTFRRGHFYTPLLLWTIVYFAIKLLPLSPRPEPGALNVYVILTELTLLALAVIFSYELAQRMYDIEKIIEMITFADLQQRVLPFESAVGEIGNELMRSRRHHRPLSLLVFAPVATSAPKEELSATLKEIQKTMLNRYIAASLAKIISKATRRIDLILEQNDHKNRFIVICPETTADGSQVVAERIRETAQEQVGISVHYGRATFP